MITQMTMNRELFSISATLLILAGLGGCGKDEKSPAINKEVIIYTALDQEFSQPILDAFEKQTGIHVRPKFDTESTKTVGLTEAILAERGRPRCDLFWNNEILHTLRLEQAGLLRAYQSPAAANYPAGTHSSNNTWHGFAARARVLIVNTNIVPEGRRPRSIKDLTDPLWYDRVAIAKPLFGTTATHAACLFTVWEEQEAKRFFKDVKRNAHILSGNRQVARAVAAGQFAFGLTDTDDAMIEIEKGSPVTIVYPDQREGELGTLFIPNTLALINGSANSTEAQQLVDYLLSAEVEKRLAAGRSAQIPLQNGIDIKLQVETPKTVRAMQVDFEAAAKKWATAAKFLRDEFTGGK